MTETPWEAAVAENMRRERVRRDWSQNELAKRLAAAGLSFHQVTVQRIEDGQRSLRLNEAMVIADVFGVDLTAMLREPDRVAIARVVLALVGEARAALVQVARSGAWVLKHQAQLADELDKLRALDDEDVDPDLVADAEDVLGQRLGDKVERAARAVMARPEWWKE